MRVWMIRSSTGQYQGKVFATEKLARKYHDSFKEWRMTTGFHSSVVPVDVIEEKDDDLVRLEVSDVYVCKTCGTYNLSTMTGITCSKCGGIVS